MSVNYNSIVGLFCIALGSLMVIVALGGLLLRVMVALLALSLINYGLKLYGLPPLQLLIPLMVSRRRWF